MSARTKSMPLIARASVAGRVLLAALGGYGVAALSTALLSLTLPLSRTEAVTIATLLSFLVMPAIVMTVFAMRTLLRALATVALIAALLGGGLWLAMGASTPDARTGLSQPARNLSQAVREFDRA